MKECNLCGSKDFKFLFSSKDMMYESRETFKVYQCSKCRLTFINPQPRNLSKYYPKNYYSFESKKSKFKERITYLYYRYGFFHFLLKLFRKIYKFRDIKPIKNRKILDVGCGYGEFLMQFRKFGMACYGVEPGDFDKKTAEKNNIKITKGELKDAEYPSDFFDIITMRHSLEHVNNPAETLAEAKRSLKKTGYLVIEVPNIDSALFRRYKKYWSHLDVPRHLFDFSEKTIKMYAKKIGLKIKRINHVTYPYSILTSIKYEKKGKGVVTGKFLNLAAWPITFFIDMAKKSDCIEVVLHK